MRAKIVILPGDGVGPEVTAAAVSVLDAVAAHFDHSFHFDEHLIGGSAIDATGEPLPAASLEACKAADAVLLGAVGGPQWSDPNAPVRPEQGLLALRAALGVYANLRPLQVHPKLAALSPLKNEKLKNVDVLFVRELTGGAYFGAKTRTSDAATDECKYTVAEVERVVRRAFDLARGRRKHVTSVDKANVLETSRLWRSTVQRIAADYPDVKAGTPAGRLDGHAAADPAVALRRGGDREPVRRHPHRRGRGAGRLAGPAAFRLDRRSQGRPVRTDPRLGTGYRRPGRGQSDRHDPVRGHVAASFAGPGTGSRRSRSGRGRGARARPAHARYRRPGDDDEVLEAVLSALDEQACHAAAFLRWGRACG